MLRTMITVSLTVLFVFSPIGTGYARHHQKPKKNGNEDAVYVVLSVVDMEKNTTFVIFDQEVEGAFRKECDLEYKEALKRWDAAKKDAQKNKIEFTEPKPNRPQIKTLKKKLTKEEADTFKQEQEEKLAAKVLSNGKSSNTKNGKEKPSKYSVVMITDMFKSVTFDTLEDETVKPLKKELDSAYKQAIKDWEAAKSEAKKNKQDFTDPKPTAPAIKVFKKGLSLEKANELLKKEEEKYVKKTVVTEKPSNKKGKK